MHYILDGFGWVTNAPVNSSKPITFYLDDIRYNLARPNTLRMLSSYVTLTGTASFDTRQRNVGYTYDNALALIAFASQGDITRTKLLADAFVYAHQHDRFYTDGRLRNAYQSGDLALPPGWYPASARLPGYWDAALNSWQENNEEVGTTTGNVAWAMLGLLTAYQTQGNSAYLSTTLELGQWVISHTLDVRGAGGFTGGYIGHEPAPTKQMWKSTEHNLDLYAAFQRMYQITGDATWNAAALSALNFVNAMNVGGQYYATGTAADGVTINPDVIPLDAQSWATLVLGDTPETRAALTTAEISHTATYNGFEGFDFNTDRDMPWPEGTAQMAVAYRIIGERGKADDTLTHLRAMQSNAPNANDQGMVAAPADGLTTGFGWGYFNRLHIGATAWHIFAERRYNPYYHSYSGSVWIPLIIRD